MAKKKKPQQRVQVTISPQVKEILERDYKGKLGNSVAEMVKNATIAFLCGQGYLSVRHEAHSKEG